VCVCVCVYVCVCVCMYVCVCVCVSVCLRRWLDEVCGWLDLVGLLKHKEDKLDFFNLVFMQPRNIKCNGLLLKKTHLEGSE
jgi:hypothetical protein